ncbi:MAG TPA: SRPBCC family protein [Bauldia sp.]|nr:SRPBCC family protein [Bauldia sp.]
MNAPGGFKVTARGEREIEIVRAFAAPRKMVFEAWTEPRYIRQWLLGPDGWSMPVCDIDLRVGGAYRYVWKNDADGRTMGMGGTFREIARPARMVATERFDEPWYPGEAVNTTTFEESGGVTTVTIVTSYATREARDGALASGMEQGVRRSYDRLDEVLAAPPPAR